MEVGTNNQVNVTVPHLDGSGVPKTLFKGNQKKYTKECVLIIDKNTGECTLERLTSNISVKKTRSESVMKPNGQMGVGSSSTSGGGGSGSSSAAGAGGSSMKISENSTQRTVSKTKVSTGVRKNNPITGFTHKHSPNQMSDYPHKSPQSAPAWNANNGQSTLPSIMMIDDDVEPMGLPQMHSSNSNNSHQNQHHMNMNSNNHHQPPPPPAAPVQSMPPMSSSSSNNNALGRGTELMSSSDSSSESSYSSDSDSSHHSAPSSNVKQQQPPANLLKEDLCLSDSNSDSD